MTPVQVCKIHVQNCSNLNSSAVTVVLKTITYNENNQIWHSFKQPSRTNITATKISLSITNKPSSIHSPQTSNYMHNICKIYPLALEDVCECFTDRYQGTFVNVWMLCRHVRSWQFRDTLTLKELDGRKRDREYFAATLSNW